MICINKITGVAVLILCSLTIVSSGHAYAAPKLNLSAPRLQVGESIGQNERIEIDTFNQSSRIALATNGNRYRLPLSASYVFDDGTSAGTRNVKGGQRLGVTWAVKKGKMRIVQKVTFEQM